MRLLILSLLSMTLSAAGQGVNVLLEHPKLLRHDQESILRGAKAFKTRCISCHSLSLAEHAPLLADAGITLAMMPIHDKSSWQGHPPPDLSLVARSRGTDWIYTYLHSFYKDPSNAKGYNNLLMPNANMPNILSDLSGVYIKSNINESHGVPHARHWFAYLEQESAGSMTPELFSYYVLDLVHFLDYVAEPQREQRQELGWKVILFLLCFAFVARLLYKSYWSEID